MNTSPSLPAAPPRANLFTQLTRVREFALLVFIVVLALLLSVTSSSFASTGNLIAVALGLASSGIVATGMLVTLAAGGVDLSVGSVLALGGVIAAVAVKAGVPVPVAFLLAVLCGSLTGLVNGLLITRVGINPLITTLGTMGIARGAAYVITQGSPIGGLPDSFGALGQNDFLGLPLPVWVLGVVVLVADFLMRRLAWARQVYYVGGNEAAARLSGIPADRVKLRVYVICSTLAALAGVLGASRFSVAAPSEGLGIELIAIAGGVIGGASLWISKTAPRAQAEAALDFALYMTSTGNMASWHKLTGYYPVRSSSVDLLRKQGWFSSTPLQILAFNQLLNTTPNVASAGALNGAAIQTRNIIEQGIQKVLSGQSVDSAVSATKEQVDAALADYNKNFK